MRAFSHKTEVGIFSFSSGPEGFEFGFISYVEDDRHLHPFSSWAFIASCGSNFVKGVGHGSCIMGGDM